MDISDFPLVDTAVNSPQNRNNVLALEKFNPPQDAVDVYRTYLRFSDDLVEYMKKNLNSSGRPSVSRYPGPAYAEFLPFDFDCEKDPRVAIAEAANFVKKWEKEYALSPEQLRIYFSGMKGISIEIPGELFGGFEPSPDIAKKLGSQAEKMTPGSRTRDTKIYDKMRLWRVPNTRHGKSRLYKVPITVEELFNA